VHGAELKQKEAQVDVDKAKYDLQVAKNQADYLRKQVRISTAPRASGS
jgi:hypothetical protein